MAKLGLSGRVDLQWRGNLLWAHKRSGATKILIFQQAIQIFALRLQKTVCVCVCARANNNISTRSGKTLQSWPLFELRYAAATLPYYSSAGPLLLL
jgi:hypothetical protein